MTVTTWLESVALARSSGSYLRYRDKVAKPDVLILDDMGMRKLSSTEAQDLCEILEERSIGKSTVFTTQLPLDHWSEVIPDPVIADAIRDRLQHAALEIQITGESYRGVKARKLASKKKEAEDPSPWAPPVTPSGGPQLGKSAGPQRGNPATDGLHQGLQLGGG